MNVFLAALGLSEAPTGPVGDYTADVTPPARSATPAVTTATALTLPTAYRSIQISAGMAGELELGAWRGTHEVPTPALLENPDPWRELSSWIERIVVCMATDGNAFLEKIRVGDRVVALPVLDPRHVTVYRRKGQKRYRYYDATTGKTRLLGPDDVVHLWNLEVPGLDRALGPIGHCRASLAGALDVRDYASGWFRRGDVPSGVLKTEQHLDPEAAKFYKKQWTDADEYGIKVLGKGLAYDPMMLSPEDAQWLESQKFSVNDIARLFGVPATYLLAEVLGNSMTYGNLEQVDAQFLRTTLFPVYLRKIEAALTSVLPRGQRARFDTSALLRPDSKTRAEINKTYVDIKVLDPEEVRIREGYGPRPQKEQAAA